MRTAYRVLAYLIAAEVVIQAAAIAYAIFGLSKYVDDGAVIDKASQESGQTFDGVVGFTVHGLNGMIVVPALALILFVVSFFAKVAGGVKWAGMLFVLVLLQGMLGGFAHDYPWLGAVHGLNALAVFSVAMMTARRARPIRTQVEPAAGADHATV